MKYPLEGSCVEGLVHNWRTQALRWLSCESSDLVGGLTRSQIPDLMTLLGVMGTFRGGPIWKTYIPRISPWGLCLLKLVPCTSLSSVPGFQEVSWLVPPSPSTMMPYFSTAPRWQSQPTTLGVKMSPSSFKLFQVSYRRKFNQIQIV